MHASAKHAFSALFEGVPGAHDDSTWRIGASTFRFPLPFLILLLKNTRFVDASKADGLPKILQRTNGSKYSETKVMFSLLLVLKIELGDHVSTKRGVLSHANMNARLGPMEKDVC